MPSRRYRVRSMTACDGMVVNIIQSHGNKTQPSSRPYRLCTWISSCIAQPAYVILPPLLQRCCRAPTGRPQRPPFLQRPELASLSNPAANPRVVRHDGRQRPWLRFPNLPKSGGTCHAPPVFLSQSSCVFHMGAEMSSASTHGWPVLPASNYGKATGQYSTVLYYTRLEMDTMA